MQTSLHKILGKTNIYTVNSFSKISKNYRYLKDLTCCRKCCDLKNKYDGIYCYPYCNQYFKYNELKNRKINSKHIIFYCQTCFTDIAFHRMHKFQCKNCNCYDNYTGIKPFINKNRTMILSNIAIGNYYFYPIKGMHDHLQSGDPLCLTCLSSLGKKGIIRKLDMDENRELNNTCTICHVYQDDYINNDDNEMCYQVIDKNIVSDGLLLYKVIDNNLEISSEHIVCYKCMENYKLEKYKYFSCDLCHEKYVPIFTLYHKQCDGLSATVNEYGIYCHYGSEYDNKMFQYTENVNYVKPRILNNCYDICDKCINQLNDDNIIMVNHAFIPLES